MVVALMIDPEVDRVPLRVDARRADLVQLLARIAGQSGRGVHGADASGARNTSCVPLDGEKEIVGSIGDDAEAAEGGPIQ